MNGIRPFSSDPDDRCGAGRKRGQFAGYVHSAPQDEAPQIRRWNPAAGRSDRRDTERGSGLCGLSESPSRSQHQNCGLFRRCGAGRHPRPQERRHGNAAGRYQSGTGRAGRRRGVERRCRSSISGRIFPRCPDLCKKSPGAAHFGLLPALFLPTVSSQTSG